ncbi:Wzz/FepE/Etk N-terminal domain-containing protein [Novosphingobium mangrovi (ex Huang et al. 2023)]|uniref:Wzz/FepE/Etk N-terminal domain-containing protein n=1 Tax=Novosphingobium mangrovi (ex Huang et al. 2023) TaxID=2976432 RepID=A0ABT2I0S4_9SPHN|nr:Wzz/FepE/Etk N-terminal domain-containing protein [Novosphingobium mangrovi (ex Huang et al. 2023)]MCT2398407.1 Wzz/FepE/Etk N-terminal domain-containing protein [Novosphingobium mangrovi (ex Huang et al. 2023)]
MSLIQLLRILWVRRAAFAISMVACLFIAVIAILVLPQQYEAKSRVLLDLMRPNAVTQQAMSNAMARAYIATQSELITDYRVAGEVVDALGWTKDPKKIAAYDRSGARGTVDLRRWLADGIIENTEAKALASSSILEITYKGKSPDEAREIADLLRTSYIEQSIAFRQEGAERNSEWFRQQADKVAAELTKAENAKTAFEKETGVVLQDDYSDPQTERLKALSNQVPVQMPGAAALVSTPSSAQLAQVDAQIASMSQTLGPNHPQMVALKQQRQALATAAAQERAAAIAASRAASATGPSLTSQVASQQAKVLAQRGNVDQLRKMQARIDVLRDQYNKTMQRASELSLEAASRESGVTLLGNAVAPESPSSPNIPLILVGAIAAGIGLGFVAAIAAELLKRRVRSIDDLAVDEVPVIGRIVSSEPAEGGALPSWFARFGSKAA